VFLWRFLSYSWVGQDLSPDCRSSAFFFPAAGRAFQFALSRLPVFVPFGTIFPPLFPLFRSHLRPGAGAFTSSREKLVLLYILVGLKKGVFPVPVLLLSFLTALAVPGIFPRPWRSGKLQDVTFFFPLNLA